MSAIMNISDFDLWKLKQLLFELLEKIVDMF